MEGKFTDYMLAQLRGLVADMEAGRRPRSRDLSIVVTKELRRQYDRDHPPKPSLEAIMGF